MPKAFISTYSPTVIPSIILWLCKNWMRLFPLRLRPAEVAICYLQTKQNLHQSEVSHSSDSGVGLTTTLRVLHGFVLHANELKLNAVLKNCVSFQYLSNQTELKWNQRWGLTWVCPPQRWPSAPAAARQTPWSPAARWDTWTGCQSPRAPVWSRWAAAAQWPGGEKTPQEEKSPSKLKSLR